MRALHEFVVLADRAKDKIPQGKVDWSGSPFAWMRHHGPRTKSKLGKDIIREWLRSTGKPFQESDDEIAHFVVGGQRCVVHLALQGKEGMIEFSQLRSPDLGVDAMFLLGIEPWRARLWIAMPRNVVHLPGYGIQKDGYHHCSFLPEETPEWLKEINCWAGSPSPAETEQMALV